MQDQIHCTEEERYHLRALVALGLHDSLRLFPQPPKSYSWWDYRDMAFRRNRGLRIDHILVSEALRARAGAGPAGEAMAVGEGSTRRRQRLAASGPAAARARASKGRPRQQRSGDDGRSVGPAQLFQHRAAPQVPQPRGAIGALPPLALRCAASWAEDGTRALMGQSPVCISSVTGNHCHLGTK
jgi:hypothetical protein